MKITGYIILFIFLQISSAYSLCLTDKANFGDNFNKVKENKEIPFLEESSPYDGQLFIPGEFICKNNEALKGSGIRYIFLNDKLVEINGNNFYAENLLILQWLEKEFGIAKNKPTNFSNENKIAHIHWEKDSYFVFYIMEKHDEGILESFQVRSKRFDNEYEDYAKKLDDEID